MERPANRVIPPVKAMLPAVFTTQVSGSQMGAGVPRHPVPLSAFGFDQVTLSEPPLSEIDEQMRQS